MSIKDFSIKIKSLSLEIKDRVSNPEKSFKIRDDLFIVCLIILVGTASFGLGKLSALEKKKTPITVLKTQEALLASVIVGNETSAENNSSSSINLDTKSITTSIAKGLVVASKSGTKYYYPWCSGVDRIKESNKVWFTSIEEAKSKGLTPAANCLGLK